MTSANQRLNDGVEATPATGKSLRLSPVPVERFDEYAVVARLGSGGMAEVILGLAQGPQGFRKLVAIKRLHAHYEDEPELVRMFLHEASLAALLQHPNVVHTHKVGSAAGRHFIAMEYLEGQPLHRALPRLRLAGAGLEPVLAARVVADALAGLAYAHDALNYDGTPLGLVHRDVSPQNLFLTYDGQVKLLDFGVAKAALAAFDLHTPTGTLKGKLGYIAPERVQGQVDGRADVWSLGVVLWEALSGTRLFRREDPAARLRAVLTDEIPSLRSLNAELPEALDKIVARALCRVRDERYASAGAMKADLDAWLSAVQPSSANKIAPESVARLELASVMQSRFADEIRARRAAVLECFAAVDHEQRCQQLAHTSAESPRTSAPPEESRLSASQNKGKRVALSVLALCAAAVLLFAAGRALRPHGEVALVAQHKRTSPASPAPAARAPQVARAQAPAPRAQAQLTSLAAAPEPKSEATAPPPGQAKAQLIGPPVQARTRARVVPAKPAGESKPAVLAAQRLIRESAKAVEPAEKGPAEPAEKLPVQAAAHEGVALGRLRLEATPYAVVSLEGKRLGITPIDVELPARAHTLMLRNPERGIETTYRVQVVAGESLLRKVELE